MPNPVPETKRVSLSLYPGFFSFVEYSRSPLSQGNMFQGLQWMLETVHSAEVYRYYVFSYTVTPMIKFTL